MSINMLFKQASPCSALATALVVLAFTATSAFAASPAGGLTVTSFAPLGEFSPAQTAECEATAGAELEQCDEFLVTVTDAGSRASGGPIVLRDELPAGVTAASAKLFLMPAAPAAVTGGQQYARRTRVRVLWKARRWW